MSPNHQAGNRRAVFVSVNSPHQSNCYTMVENTDHCSLTSCLIFLNTQVKFPIWLHSSDWMWMKVLCATSSPGKVFPVQSVFHTCFLSLLWSWSLKTHIKEGRGTDRKNLGSCIIAWKTAIYQQGKPVWGFIWTSNTLRSYLSHEALGSLCCTS